MKGLKTYFFLSIVFVFFSCTNNSEVKYFEFDKECYKIFDDKNNLIEIKCFYDNKKEKLFKHIIKNREFDSLKMYYDNGNLYLRGMQTNNGLKIGEWKRYTKEGYLSEVKEYFLIKDDYVLNRKFYFNKLGDTVWYAKEFNRYNQKEFIADTLKYRNSDMNLFDFYTKDTISINEPFAASVRCNSPLARNYDSEIMMLLAKENKNFNNNFSNEKEVVLDTFYNLSIDVDNKINFPNANPNYVAVFGRWFDTPGEKVLRGYMLEYFKRNLTENDSILSGERRVYFEKKIYVKGNVNSEFPKI